MGRKRVTYTAIWYDDLPELSVGKAKEKVKQWAVCMAMYAIAQLIKKNLSSKSYACLRFLGCSGGLKNQDDMEGFQPEWYISTTYHCRDTFLFGNRQYHPCLSWCLSGWSWQFFNYECMFKGVGFFLHVRRQEKEAEKERKKKEKYEQKKREKIQKIHCKFEWFVLVCVCVCVCLGACMKVHRIVGCFFLSCLC